MNLIDTIESCAQACIDEQTTRREAALESPSKGRVALIQGSQIKNLDNYPAFLAAVNALSEEQCGVLCGLAEAGMYPEDAIEDRLAADKRTCSERHPLAVLRGITRARAENFDFSLFEV